MNLSGSWEITIWAGNQIPMGVAPVPDGPAGKATFTNTNIIGINASSEHPEEAWTFLKWLYGREAQLEYVRRYGMQPVLLSLGYDWVEMVVERIRNAGHPEVTGIEAFVTGSAYAMPQPFFAKSAVIGQYIQPVVNQIMTESTAIAPALESMVAAARPSCESKTRATSERRRWRRAGWEIAPCDFVVLWNRSSRCCGA